MVDDEADDEADDEDSDRSAQTGGEKLMRMIII